MSLKDIKKSNNKQFYICGYDNYGQRNGNIIILSKKEALKAVAKGQFVYNGYYQAVLAAQD